MVCMLAFICSLPLLTKSGFTYVNYLRTAAAQSVKSVVFNFHIINHANILFPDFASD